MGLSPGPDEGGAANTTLPPQSLPALQPGGARGGAGGGKCLSKLGVTESSDISFFLNSVFFFLFFKRRNKQKNKKNLPVNKCKKKNVAYPCSVHSVFFSPQRTFSWDGRVRTRADTCPRGWLFSFSCHRKAGFTQE